MSGRKGNCPQCGAPVVFRFSSAVQTVCTYCHSVLVRHDVDLEKVGVQADLPLTPSPIQIGTEGVFRGKAFYVAGRIAYEYEQGGWNEWHLAFQDGASGWLSDAQADYAVSWLYRGKEPPLAAAELTRGRSCRFDNTLFQVTSITHARYVGVEGELPFQYWNKQTVVFADLRSTTSRFATIDYSEEPPFVFVGEAVEFDDLRLKNLREFEGWQP